MRAGDPERDLASLLASKGVPPFLVAANITEANYREVRLWKEDGRVRVRATCVDDETQKELIFLYHYDAENVLQQIEMQVGSNRSVIWDRKEQIAMMARRISAPAVAVP